jgi:uncharacterized repeat protein (TIGR02059 family)
MGMFVNIFMSLVKMPSSMRSAAIIILLCLSITMSGKTYYVATTGKDTNTGTISSPWGTWQKAFNTAVAGDTVFFRGGTWYPTPAYGNNVLKIEPYGYTPVGYDGTADNPICYFNYPGETPVLDGRNLDITSRSFNTMIMMYDCNFIYFRGIEIRNMFQPKVSLEVAVGINGNNCQNMRFENMNIHDISGRGYQFLGGFGVPKSQGGPVINIGYDTTRWINCDSYNICDSLSANPGNAGDGWKTNNYPGSVFIHDGCRAWNCSDDGFDPSNNVICYFKNCWSFSNGINYLSLDEMEGNGFKSGGVSDENLVQNPTRFYTNCIAANNSGAGYYDLDYDPYLRTNARYYNSIAYHNGWGFYGIRASLPRTSTYKNCIAYGSTNINEAGMPADVLLYYIKYPESHNTWDWYETGFPYFKMTDSVTVTNSDFVSLDYEELKWARKGDGSLPDINFMKLATGSDLIDAGIDVGLPFYGNAPDIGCSEFISGAVTPVTPVYLSSIIEPSTPSRVDITYNLTLVNIVPPASAFTVKVNTITRTVSSITVSGTKVQLTLASPVNYGDVVTVSYTKPASNPLQTVSGGQAASFSAQNVTNNVVPVSPVYVNAVIENATPARLEMTYNLTLANIVPVTSAFTVKVNAVTRVVSSVNVSGTKVQLTLYSPVAYGDMVTVAYTKPSVNPLQTTALGQASSLAAQSVVNNVGPVSPIYVSAVIENVTPARLEMTYNLSLANIVPAVSAFTVSVNSVTRSVNSVTISGTKVQLSLATPVVYGDVVTAAYTKPASNPLQTVSGGQAASFSAQNVTNNVVPVSPVYVSSVIENATPARVDMTYNLTLANFVPAASAFTILVNTVARTVSSVTISGTKVQLSLATPVVYGDVVTAAYTKPASNPLQTASGGQAASITAQSVINNCSLIANQPPVINITSPTKSTAFISPATITIDAAASDPDGTISIVEFYNGSIKLGERAVAPYSFVWKDVTDGTYIVSAIATDNAGSKTVSAAVSVVVSKSATDVNQLPVVTITSPGKSQKHKKHDNVVIEVVATDPDGTISKVELKSGDITITELSSAPYIFTLQDVDTGTYVITAIATDNLGAVSSSNLEFMVTPLFNVYPDNINLFPNPNDGHFSFELLSPLLNNECKITVTNLAGKQVYSGILTAEQITDELDMSTSAPGTYILMITSRNTIIAAKKFIMK